MKHRLDLLREVRGLQSTYHVGALDALSFLRVRDEYTGLQRALQHEFQREGITQDPTVKELSNLCYETRRVVGQSLAFFYVVSRDPSELSEIPLTELTGASPHIRPYSRHIGLLERDEVVDFAYLSFLLDFYRERDQGSSVATSFGRALFGLWENKQYFAKDNIPLDIRAAVATVETPSEPLYPELIDPEHERDAQKDLVALTSYVLHADNGSVNELDSREVMYIPRLHKVTEEAAIFLFGSTIGKPDRGDELLVGEDTYHRAQRESTLRLRVIERKVALATIIRAQDTFLFPMSPDEIVESIMESVGTGIQRSKKALDHFKDLEGMDDANAAVEFSLERRMYILRALRKNRDWLIDALNSDNPELL